MQCLARKMKNPNYIYSRSKIKIWWCILSNTKLTRYITTRTSQTLTTVYKQTKTCIVLSLLQYLTIMHLGALMLLTFDLPNVHDHPIPWTETTDNIFWQNKATKHLHIMYTDSIWNTSYSLDTKFIQYRMYTINLLHIQIFYLWPSIRFTMSSDKNHQWPPFGEQHWPNYISLYLQEHQRNKCDLDILMEINVSIIPLQMIIQKSLYNSTCKSTTRYGYIPEDDIWL